VKRALILCVSLIAAGCRQQQSADVWRQSDPTYVPFAVQAIAASSSNRFVGLTVDERPQNDKQTLSSDYVVYMLDLKTGTHRKVGQNAELIALPDDQFFFFDSDKSSKPSMLIRGLDTVRTFDVGEHNGGWWNPKMGTIMMETGWPKDTDGFNALGLINVATGAVTKTAVQQTSELIGICPANGNFYTEHRSIKDELGADEYDGSGKFIRTIRSPLAVYSAECTYGLPFAAIGLHGPDDWGVFHAASGQKLMDFPWNEDGKSDLHWFRAWNPRRDSLLLMYSTEGATKKDTVDALDVAQRKVVKSWPHPEGSPPIEWSGDGSAVVTVRDQQVVFDSLGN